MGTWNDIAIPPDGRPVVSYYDATNGNLKFARCANTACTGIAAALTVDASANDVGQYSSIAIGADGRVTGFVGKIEMGQGAMTSLAQALAEELDVPISTVDIVMGDTDLCPYDRGTFGSMTTRFYAPQLKTAAAQAKSILKQLKSR